MMTFLARMKIKAGQRSGLCAPGERADRKGARQLSLKPRPTNSSNSGTNRSGYAVYEQFTSEDAEEAHRKIRRISRRSRLT